MSFLLDKLAAVAAQATAPQPQPGGAGQQMDPNMDPAMQAPMDPIEEDNQRLTNILENLRLRQEIVQAHEDLDSLSQKQAKKPSAPKDPDAATTTPTKSDQIMEASTIKDLLQRTPQLKIDNENIVSGNKSRKADDAAGPNKATAPGRADAETLKSDPTTIG